MNFLVTGASGLIGSSICKFLLSKKHKVTGIVNKQKNSFSNENYKEISLDLANSPLLPNEDFDCVIHTAAIIPGKNNSDSQGKQFELNTCMDENVINYCKNKGSKLIYFSTVYFYNGEASGVLNEESPLQENLNGYFLVKHNTEQKIKTSSIQNYSILRVSSPYGTLSLQNNVMKLLTNKASQNETITLIGKGERKQNFIHVEDIAEASSRLSSIQTKDIFNLTYKSSYTMLELATYIKQIQKSDSEIEFDTSKPDQYLNVNFSNNKLKTLLNWEPSIDLKTGLLKTLSN